MSVSVFISRYIFKIYISRGDVFGVFLMTSINFSSNKINGDVGAMLINYKKNKHRFVTTISSFEEKNVTFQQCVLHTYLCQDVNATDTCSEWAIPEIIHTPPYRRYMGFRKKSMENLGCGSEKNLEFHVGPIEGKKIN